MRPEKSQTVALSRGFESRHLHEGCGARHRTRGCRLLG